MARPPCAIGRKPDSPSDRPLNRIFERLRRGPRLSGEYHAIPNLVAASACDTNCREITCNSTKILAIPCPETREKRAARPCRRCRIKLGDIFGQGGIANDPAVFRAALHPDSTGLSTGCVRRSFRPAAGQEFFACGRMTPRSVTIRSSGASVTSTGIDSISCTP